MHNASPGRCPGLWATIGLSARPIFFSQPQNICQTAPIVLLKHQSPHYLPWQQTLSREIFFVSAWYFSLSAMTFFIFSEIFFVTNLLTCITNFVTCITNFLTCVTKFVTKNILADRKKLLGGKEDFSRRKEKLCRWYFRQCPCLKYRKRASRLRCPYKLWDVGW